MQRKQEEARYRQEYQARLASNRQPDRRVAARPRDPRLRLVVEEDANAPGKDLSPDPDLGRWLGWARRHADTFEHDAVQTALDLQEPAPRSPVRW